MGRPAAPSRPASSAGMRPPVGRLIGRASLRRVACAVLLAIVPALLPLTALPSTALAQGAAPAAAAVPGAPGTPPKMLIEANELVQNDNDKTVSAVGNVRIYYKGKILEADRVVYNKVTKRLMAFGNAKLTEKDGTIHHGESMELTSDFNEGFVNTLRTDTTPGKDQVHFSAPRMERSGEGDTSVFTKGTYTACDTCKDKPDRPPLWRIRAKRIIHKNNEQMIYYEDAYLEFLGIPVAYTPYMSAPDPTVKKKSGLLSPKSFYRNQLGYGVSQPVFYNIADDYDLTFTPTYFTRQGFFGAGEFRQKTQNGLYYIRASGIDQQDPSAFYPKPYGSGTQRLRGDISTKGEFQINDRWKFGWNITALSDKYFLYDYSVPADSMSSNYFSESISTIYLTGQGERSFFDLRGYYIQGLTAYDLQTQQPVAAPIIDYNRTFDIDPAKTHGIGGQVEADFNFTSLNSQAASYQNVGARTLDGAYGLYDVCNVYQPGRTLGNSCLLRGIGGDYTRATAQLTYQRQYIDPIGEVWTPFAFARLNGAMLNLNTTNVSYFNNSGATASFTNASQTNFLPGGSGTTGYVVPGVGVEWRYPFLTRLPFGNFVAEPVAQVIARPDRVLGSTSLVNLDAQSLVFDSNNLFDWNKFSGYDRFETGLRANYGGRFTLNMNNGGYAKVTLGQSAQLAGQNGYAVPDAANIGLSSGLDTRASDYVAGATFSPAPFLTLGGQGRFDVSTMQARRYDGIAQLNFGKLTGGVQYASYQAQPLIGYSVRRSGLLLNGRYDFIDHYFVNGNITFDLSRSAYPLTQTLGQNIGTFPIASFGVGAGYTDECTTFLVSYTSYYQYVGIGPSLNNTILVSLQLRTLGDLSFSRVSGAGTGLDNTR